MLSATPPQATLARSQGGDSAPGHPWPRTCWRVHLRQGSGSDSRRQGTQQSCGHGDSQRQRSHPHPSPRAAGQRWRADAPWGHGTGDARVQSCPLRRWGPWETPHIPLGDLGVFQVLMNSYPWSSAETLAVGPSVPCRGQRTSSPGVSVRRSLGPSHRHYRAAYGLYSNLLNPAAHLVPRPFAGVAWMEAITPSSVWKRFFTSFPG